MVFQQYAPRTLKFSSVYRNTAPPDPAPRITIVTPSFNQAHFIGATIESVLGQGYPNLAYHVQDGGSTDNTSSLLKRLGPPVTWASAPDDGQANAINRGFSKVEGDIMSYLNSDDLLTPGTLAYIARFFSANPGVDIVYGHRIFIDAGGREIGRAVLPPHDAEALKWFDYVPQETLFWRRRVWTALGGIDESFRFAMDWDFILRAQAAGMTFKRLPRFLGCFRVHIRQKTTAMLDIGSKEMAILRQRQMGRIPSDGEVRDNMKPYLRRHVIVHRLYKLRVLDY
jgi:glycosyltransferase involved in cell wall biosynthesis